MKGAFRMISRFGLKNFRCFEDFTLDGIKNVNLIAGGNNVGKSALLESIFLFMCRYNPNGFFTLNALRGITQTSITPEMIWESLFSNYNIDNELNICAVYNGDEQSLTLSKGENKDIITPFSQVQDSDKKQNTIGNYPTQSNLGSYPLKVDFKSSNSNAFYYFSPPVGIDWRNAPTETAPVATYISSLRQPYAPDYVAVLLSKLDTHGKKSECVDIVKEIDNRIKDLVVLTLDGIGNAYADLGFPRKLPINILGDGVNKLLHIILTMLTNPNGIVLVDEIENGFHYSFLPKLWKIISELAVETKCQVFATTHSYECINAAVPIANSNESSELFNFMRLDRVEGVTFAKVYDNDSFEFAVENKWEVR